ncbi:MAG: alpha-1,4-glucan--maltose-1-phosphate maltosyltransferase [Bacteroidia bacterium]|nr:alpha-1,4-glucan--maltose-1-phosphate maltosyltransferase [Bacteroidia bacterium]
MGRANKNDRTGFYEYKILGRINYFGTWQKNLRKKYEAQQDIQVELLIGAEMMQDALGQAHEDDQNRLRALADQARQPQDIDTMVSTTLDNQLTDLVNKYENHDEFITHSDTFQVMVERTKALYSTWYELFPRSTAPEPGRHGTFRDVERVLPEIVRMGFDVLYLPPIHPIGRSFRKGRNNSTTSQLGEPGSPWAIGATEGGHKDIHPELGTLEDFRDLIQTAQGLGLEIAMDLAFQCSPDHPYVKEHPQWFKWRPDGTVQYAENPPKKYQDILPIYFENDDWENLWQELKSVVLHWINQGINIFRVDNPHTKPFNFWEWLIAEVRQEHPQVIFLSEAFTRPRIMERLAQIGFTQSYTYFTWRNTSAEFQEYLTELTKTDMRDYFRPNFWPNTPDILPGPLQNAGTPSFIMRLVLAATLSSNYGIYGPVFEFGLNSPYPGKEEYVDSEKYEIKHWNWEVETPVKEMIVRINRIRRNNPALQTTWNLYFGQSSNDQLLCYGKTDDDATNRMFMVVCLDAHHPQNGWVEVPLEKLGLQPDYVYIAHDLITGSKYRWQGTWNYVELNPYTVPAHVFRLEEY